MSSMAFKKDPWRQRTFQCMKKFGTLNKPYVEFAGEEPDAMFEVLRRNGAIAPKDYYAVDNNAETLMQVVIRLKRPAFHLIYGDAYAEIPFLLQKGVCFATFGLDGTSGINQQWWKDHNEPLMNMLHLASRQVPRLLLLMNHTLDRGAEKGLEVMERIVLHADNLTSAFRSWGLRKDDLMKGAEDVLQWEASRSFYGGFDIYRSADRHNRMVTVRLMLDCRERRIKVYRG